MLLIQVVSLRHDGSFSRDLCQTYVQQISYGQTSVLVQICKIRTVKWKGLMCYEQEGVFIDDI